MGLKKRVSAAIIVRNGWAVQSIGFSRYLPVGDPAVLAETLDRWEVDEILLQDISASQHGRGPDLTLIQKVAERISTPLAVAGGIKTVDAVHSVIACGADKVIVNTAGIKDPTLYRRTADLFGRQCIVGSIDFQRGADGQAHVFNRLVSPDTLKQWSLLDWVSLFQSSGVGEVLLNSVDRDGLKVGFDMEVIDQVASILSVPLVVIGGARSGKDVLEVLKHSGVAAAGAANMWSFSEQSVLYVKSHLAAQQANVRLDHDRAYIGRGLSSDGRPYARRESELDGLIYGALL
jgi:imidazole glycerol-phosphate synthase subunit HisF